MPEYDFNEKHEIRISAGPNEVFRALQETDLADSFVIRTLFFLRGLPTGKMKLSELKKMKFEPLGKIENHEILLGLVGQFWKITGKLQSVRAEDFKSFNKTGFAKTTWNFSLAEETPRKTLLRTETRIRCSDEKSRTGFGWYWTFVQPFSGLIRMEMLRTIKREAEKNF